MYLTQNKKQQNSTLLTLLLLSWRLGAMYSTKSQVPKKAEGYISVGDPYAKKEGATVSARLGRRLRRAPASIPRLHPANALIMSHLL